MFKKFVVFDYYDGPISGIACEDDLCQNVSRFDLLAWDDQQDERIFCLGRLHDGPSLFNQVVDCCRKNEPENWPVWCPSPAVSEDREQWEQISGLIEQQRDYQSVLLADQIYDEPKIVSAISVEMRRLIQDFVRTSEMQDFETCKKLLRASIG